MTKFKVIKLRQKTYLKGRLRIKKFEDLVNEFSDKGWPLMAFVPVGTWSLLQGKKDMFLTIFKREEEDPVQAVHPLSEEQKIQSDQSVASPSETTTENSSPKPEKSVIYKIIPLRQKTLLKGRIRAQQFEDTLNKYSAEGWDLVRILSGKTFSILKGKKELFLFVFKRTVEKDSKTH